MKDKIIKHKAVSVACLGAIAIIFGGFLWAYFKLRAVENGLLVIHFNDISGVTESGTLRSIVSIGVFGAIVTIVNFFIAIELEERSHFLGKVVAVASGIFAVLLFIALAAILNAN